MKRITTITELIREQIKNYYEMLKYEHYKKLESNDEEDNVEIEGIETYIDEVILSNDCSDFETDVSLKILKQINSSKYKNIIYLIMMQDVWEYLKSRDVSRLPLMSYENATLEFLENWDIKKIFKKLNSSSDFDLNLLTIFLEYHDLNDIENRIKNKTIIELTGNDQTFNKFKINVIDDIQYEYVKRKF